MKTNTTTAPLATSAASLVNESKGTVETIRSVEQLTREAFVIHDDGRVDIRDKNTSASEFALFIADREATGQRFKTQARWTFYAAGKQSTDLQNEIAKRLKEMMSSSAFAQLKSEANSQCPVAIANGIKAPLSLLKDAMAEIKVNPATGKLLPMGQQSKAARVLIPKLQEGGKAITQAAIRDIRKQYSTTAGPKGNGNPPAPASGPTAKPDSEVTIGANVIRALQDAAKGLDSVRLEGGQLTQAVNLLTDCGRKLGLVVTVVGASEAPKAPATAPAKK